jgi:hypothetical protein
MSCSARRVEGEAHCFDAAARPLYRSSPPLARASAAVVTQDTLSDVLRGVRLRGAVFFNVSGSSDWAAEAPPASVLAPMLMRGVEHVIEYHALAQGHCWAAIPGGPSVEMFAGDVVMFPHGDAHVVSSTPGLRGSAEFGWMAETKNDRLPVRLAYRGNSVSMSAVPDGDAEDRLICGFIGCDLQPFNPLISALPRLLHLRAGDDNAWIGAFAQRAVAESHAHRAGGEAMLAKMSEMMFVDAVRRYADRLPAESRGWLAGLRDRFVGRTPGADARAAGASLEHRRARPPGRPLAFGAARALRAADRRAADAVPGAVAHAGRGAVAARDPRPRRRDRPRGRLRLGSGVRPRLQAGGRHAAGRLAAGARPRDGGQRRRRLRSGATSSPSTTS